MGRAGSVCWGGGWTREQASVASTSSVGGGQASGQGEGKNYSTSHSVSGEMAVLQIRQGKVDKRIPHLDTLGEICILCFTTLIREFDFLITLFDVRPV